MADLFEDQLTDASTLEAGDSVRMLKLVGAAEESQNIPYADFLSWIQSNVEGVTSGPQSFGDNYVITPSIATNNLTVALKTVAGGNAAANDKISFRIGNTKRELSAALSVTVNAGANTFNAGAAELLAQNIDFFTYVGWRAASSTMFILISRFPNGRTYADFSSTSTNEKYGAYSGSAPASTDAVENIGRFRAQNSGSASYNWSIPSVMVINRPIYHTDWLSYTPQITPGSGAFTTLGTVVGTYRFHEDCMDFTNSVPITTNGTAAGFVRSTLPWTFTGIYVGSGRETGVAGKMLAVTHTTTNTFFIHNYDNSYPGADTYVLSVSGNNWKTT